MTSANELRQDLQDRALHAEIGHHKLATFGEGSSSSNSDRRLRKTQALQISYVQGRVRHFMNPIISESDASGKSGKSDRLFR